jgi:hypothetical protein
MSDLKLVRLATRSKPDPDPVASMAMDADGRIIVTTESGRRFHVATCEQQERELSAVAERLEEILSCNPPEASA